jgi:hypothetical protein
MPERVVEKGQVEEGAGCPIASGGANKASEVSRPRRGFRFPKIKVSAFTAGLVMGGGAAFIQAYLFIIPPPAYGICMVCHPKDLLNWLADHLLGTNWGNTTVSVDVPVLTVVGIVLGALVAARQHGEFRLESAREPLFHFMTGFLVINFGLILGSCPIRIIIVSSYGSVIGILGYASLVVGAVLGSIWLRQRARREVRQRMLRT